MGSYFQASDDYPYHLSIGAVVRNERGEIAAHYFDTFSHPAVGEFKDFYLLMRETPEPGESIEETLARGLREEFGAVGKLISYIGPIIASFSKGSVVIEKTTLYFLCDLISIDATNRAKDDPEAVSEIRFLPISELITAMKDQRKRIGREDMDESTILQRVVAQTGQSSIL